MASTWTMIVLLVFYAAITVMSLLEHNWWRALYYVGAIVISVSVLGMTQKATCFAGVLRN